MAWNTSPPSTQLKLYLNFDTTSYTYRRLLSSLPCPHQLFFSLYGLFEVIRAAPFCCVGATSQHRISGSYRIMLLEKSCKLTAEKLEKSCNIASKRLEKSCKLTTEKLEKSCNIASKILEKSCKKAV